MRRTLALTALLLVAAVAAALVIAGCGGEAEDESGATQDRPESVTAYQAVQYTEAAADKWQKKNWVVQVRDGDPDGVTREGKAKIWEVYYFSPRPEVNSRMLVIYNRGNVWPNTPGRSRGGEEGQEVYRKNEPKSFRVDSGEACTVALRNGGGDYMDAHPDGRVSVALRCRADYDAIKQEMPAPKYKWIWTVTYSSPDPAAPRLEVYVDGMNADFISKEEKQTSY